MKLVRFSRRIPVGRSEIKALIRRRSTAVVLVLAAALAAGPAAVVVAQQEGLSDLSGARWESRVPPNTPPPRDPYQGLAYHASSREVIYLDVTPTISPGIFGPNPTWAWSGEDWSEVSPHLAGSRCRAIGNEPCLSPLMDVRGRTALVYDAARDETLLLGRSHEGTSPSGDDRFRTWAWNGVTWKDVSDRCQEACTSPPLPDSDGLAAAYDSERREVVFLHLGERFDEAAGRIVYSHTTWVWNGAGWSEVTPEKSGSRCDLARHYQCESISEKVTHGGLAYHPPSCQMVFGGGYFELPRSPLGDRPFSEDHLAATWLWDGLTWTRHLSPDTPVHGGAFAIAYNEATSGVVMVPNLSEARNFTLARDASTNAPNRTWIWRGAGWVPGPAWSGDPRANHAMAYDAANAEAIVFGGQRTTPPASVPNEVLVYHGVERGPDLPEASIDNATAVEGPGGTMTEISVKVSLAPSSCLPVGVNYSTRPDTATADDYVETSGRLDFAPGQSEHFIKVQVKGDDIYDPGELFFLDLSVASGVTLKTSTGMVSITDDDTEAKKPDDPDPKGSLRDGGDATSNDPIKSKANLPRQISATSPGSGGTPGAQSAPPNPGGPAGASSSQPQVSASSSSSAQTATSTAVLSSGQLVMPASGAAMAVSERIDAQIQSAYLMSGPAPQDRGYLQHWVWAAATMMPIVGAWSILGRRGKRSAFPGRAWGTQTDPCPAAALARF